MGLAPAVFVLARSGLPAIVASGTLRRQRKRGRTAQSGLSSRGGPRVRRLAAGASEIRTTGAAAKGPAVASLVGRPALNGAAQLIDPAFIPARPGRPVSQDETGSLNPSSSSGESRANSTGADRFLQVRRSTPAVGQRQSGFGPTTSQRWRSKSFLCSSSSAGRRSESASMRPPAAAGV